MAVLKTGLVLSCKADRKIPILFWVTKKKDPEEMCKKKIKASKTRTTESDKTPKETLKQHWQKIFKL